MRTEELGPRGLAQLVSLCAASMPGERLAPEELGICWDDPGIVLSAADGAAAIAAVTRSGPDGIRGYIRLLAVHPNQRRRGLGLALLREAIDWLGDQGAITVGLGGEIPVYLWPGVDVTNLAGLALAQRVGFRVSGIASNLSLATSLRRPAPRAVRIARLLDQQDIAEVRGFLATHWPVWLTEFDRGVARGTAFGAFGDLGDLGDLGNRELVTPDPGTGQAAWHRQVRAVGFCNHSNMRTGWIGPLGVHPAARGSGIGTALLAATCADLASRGIEVAQVAWVGPLSLFADLGARPSRTFARMSRALDVPT